MSAIGLEADAAASPQSDSAIGISAQRKAAIRLLPIISIGYGSPTWTALISASHRCA